MRLFSFLTICTGIHAQLEEKQEFEFEVYHRGGPEKIYTWREAKNFCQTLHDGWQLVIVNSPTKQKAIDEAFIAAGAQDDDALWIGFMNEDGWGANSADAQLTTDLYGNRAVYTNYGPGEPNNKRGSPKDERGENCVRMRYKKGKTFWEDALCGRGDTFKSRKGKKAYKNSFACEPRPLMDLGPCDKLPEEEIPDDDNYRIMTAEKLGWNEARMKCQAINDEEGQDGWDLVVFEQEEELQYVKMLINCLPESFWVGYREFNGIAKDAFGRSPQIEIPWWVNKPSGDLDDPNNPGENCVRMQNGKFTDEECTHANTGQMREALGVGYVCERHTHIVYDAEPAKTCEENEHGILPYRVQSGCPTPSYCTATTEIVDAWSAQKRGKGQSFGLALKVSIPNMFRWENKATGYSILIRFPQDITSANFQVFNFNFFNFYKSGSEILLHSKFYTNPSNDGFDLDKNSFLLLVEGLPRRVHPMALAFKGRTKRHECFDPSMHARSGRPGKPSFSSEIREFAQDKYGSEVTLDHVQSFGIRNGALKRIRAKSRKQKVSSPFFREQQV